MKHLANMTNMVDDDEMEVVDREEIGGKPNIPRKRLTAKRRITKLDYIKQPQENLPTKKEIKLKKMKFQETE